MFCLKKLMKAFVQGNLEEAQNPIFSNETPLNQKTSMDSMHLACWLGQIDVVERLLQQGNININRLDSNGESFIDVAYSMGHKNIVKLLLQQKMIDTDILENDTIKFTPLNIACRFGHIDIVELLLDQNVDINQINRCGQTSLHIACEKGQENIIKLLLQQNNIELNIIDKNGSTPLHLACRHGHENIVKLLLQKNKIDLNQMDKKGKTALHIACEKEHKNIVALIIKQPHIMVNQIDKYNFTPLHCACDSGNENIVDLLLQKKQTKINRDDNNGEILIANAIRHNRTHIAKMLIEKLSQSPEGLQPLKPFMLEGGRFNSDIKTTCLIELAEKCPEILEILNSIRNQKIKSARAVVDNSHQNSCLKNPTPVDGHGFYKNIKQTEKNDLEIKPTVEIKYKY